MSRVACFSTFTSRIANGMLMRNLIIPLQCRHSTFARRAVSTSTQLKLQQDPNEVKPWSQSGKLREKIHERDFFLSVLSANATKRDAKSYLSRYKPSQADNARIGLAKELQHIALIKIDAIQDVEDEVLIGLAHTFAQLERLGLRCVIVVDGSTNSKYQDESSQKDDLGSKADRLVSYLQKYASLDACRMEHVLGVAPTRQEVSATIRIRGAVEVTHGDMLSKYLTRGKVPVFTPTAYTEISPHSMEVQADDIMLALTRQFAGLTTSAFARAGSNQALSERESERSPPMLLERIIVLDPLGGLPSATRADKSHVFINLEQEYRHVREELVNMVSSSAFSNEKIDPKVSSKPTHSVFGASNPFTKVLEEEVGSPGQHKSIASSTHNTGLPLERHVHNLDLLNNALSLLPRSSSALLTTPSKAATLAATQDTENTNFGVSTKSPRNPLIYNLLTDKPIVSSSLPVSRLQPNSKSQKTHTNPVTLVKKGMPLTMIPFPPNEGWQPPDPSAEPFSLNDSRIDLPRLMNLIEDSFNRPLDINHYLKRIRNKLAGVIVAGEYEGGAILTWELPPGVLDDGSEESRSRMVPYLDKFAVLKRSQGAGGVADILFTAMVRRSFPNGVCWRSRITNPVNKWYFERSRGTWKLPESDWAMFWTTPSLFEERDKFLDYEGVCRNIVSSWADKKSDS